MLEVCRLPFLCCIFSEYFFLNLVVCSGGSFDWIIPINYPSSFAYQSSQRTNVTASIKQYRRVNASGLFLFLFFSFFFCLKFQHKKMYPSPLPRKKKHQIKNIFLKVHTNKWSDYRLSSSSSTGWRRRRRRRRRNYFVFFLSFLHSSFMLICFRLKFHSMIINGVFFFIHWSLISCLCLVIDLFIVWLSTWT